MEKFDKLLMKKKKDGSRELSDNEKDAKMSVVHALQQFASGEISKKLQDRKPAGHAEENYLDAKKHDKFQDADEGKDTGDFQLNDSLGDTDEAEAVDGHDNESLEDESAEDPNEEAHETADEEKAEGDDEDESSIDAKLKALMDKKAKFKKA